MKTTKKAVRKAAEARKKAKDKNIRKARVNGDAAGTAEAPILRARDKEELRVQLEKLSPKRKVPTSADYHRKKNHEPMMLGIWVGIFLDELRFSFRAEQNSQSIPPDFSICSDGEEIGLEVTKIDNEVNQRFAAIARGILENPPENLRSGAIAAGTPPEIVDRALENKQWVRRRPDSNFFRSPDGSDMGRKEAREKVMAHLIFPNGGFNVNPGIDTIAECIMERVSSKTETLRKNARKDRKGVPCELIIDYNQLPDNSVFGGFRSTLPGHEWKREGLLDWLRQNLIPKIRADGVLRRVVVFSFDGRSCFITDARSGKSEFRKCDFIDLWLNL